MRSRVLFPLVVLAAGLGLSMVAFAQEKDRLCAVGYCGGQERTEVIGPGWKTCPHCLTPKEGSKELSYDSLNLPFKPRDISGVYISRPDKMGPNSLTVIDTVHDVFGKDQDSTGIRPAYVPDLTPYGKKLFDATRTDFRPPDGTRVTNSKDGMLKCDPLGWPRWFGYNYGIEFIVLPDRVLQFIEWGHAWRTIWTDGRKLPENPPEPRWLGYAVGHWEDDDTFVVESTGYEERSWLSEAGNFSVQPGSKGWGMAGWPHSDEMRIVERWKRVSYGTLEGQVTVYDPKVYTKPFASPVVKHTFLPDAEIGEYFCVPSDNEALNNRIIFPGNGAPAENTDPKK